MVIELYTQAKPLCAYRDTRGDGGDGEPEGLEELEETDSPEEELVDSDLGDEEEEEQ